MVQTQTDKHTHTHSFVALNCHIAFPIQPRSTSAKVHHRGQKKKVNFLSYPTSPPPHTQQTNTLLISKIWREAQMQRGRGSKKRNRIVRKIFLRSETCLKRRRCQSKILKRRRLLGFRFIRTAAKNGENKDPFCFFLLY